MSSFHLSPATVATTTHGVPALPLRTLRGAPLVKPSPGIAFRSARQTSSGSRRTPLPVVAPRATTSSGNGAAAVGADAPVIESMDVSASCVNPVFRSFPKASDCDAPGSRTAVRVLFLSEGNVCRSVIAEATFRAMLASKGLTDYIECESKGVRDYNVGERPSPRVLQLAVQSGVLVDEGKRAELMLAAEDVVIYDVMVVMDKFNAADVLKEVSVFDTIDSTAKFSSKVRRMGDFCKTRVIEDIDDPLYGNMGGPEELDLLSCAINDIYDCCHGLMEQLEGIRGELEEGESFRAGVKRWLEGMDDMDWLVPPMLQKKNK